MRRRWLAPHISLLLGLLLLFTSCALPFANGGTTAMSPKARTYLDEAFSFVQKGYVDRDKVDWPTLRTAVFAQAQTAQTYADTYDAIHFLITTLGNHHTFFLDPDQDKQLKARQTYGFGLASGYTQSAHALIVTEVYPGGPAAKAGIETGDAIVAIDGQPVTHFESLSGTDHITFEIRRSSLDHTITAKLDAAPFTMPCSAGRRLPNAVGYIDLYTFVGDDTQSLNCAIQTQQIARDVDASATCGWIIDLRQDGGGNQWAMLAGIGPILGEGKAGALDIPGGGVYPWSYQHGEAINNGNVIVQVAAPYQLKRDHPPVAVLTSSSTGSSGEIMALSFVGRSAARSFGGPTGGFTTVNQSHQMPDGAVLVVTVGYDEDRTGHIYHGESVTPDQQADTNWLSYGTDDDPTVQAARTWLAQQPQCRH